MLSFKINPHSKHILIANTECLVSVTRNVYQHYIDWCVKNSLEVVDGELSHDF